MTGQVFLDDDHGEAGGSHVLLSAGVDQAELAHVHGTGENVGGHVADHGHLAGLGDILPLGALDGVVGAVIEVVGLGVQLQLILAGDVDVLLVLGGSGDVHGAVLLGFLHGLVGEVAGNGVISLAGAGQQVQGDHAELHGGAALEEEDLIALGDVHQLAELGLGIVEDLLEHLGAVAHLHNGHAGAIVVGDFRAGALEDLQRKHGGTCGEIENAIVGHGKRLLSNGWYR